MTIGIYGVSISGNCRKVNRTVDFLGLACRRSEAEIFRAVPRLLNRV